MAIRNRTRTRYVRQMPRIYGNLQPQRPAFFGYLKYLPALFWSLAGLGLVYAVLFSGIFSIKTVEVQGAQLSDPDRIKAAVPVGQSIWLLSKGQVADRVAEDPAIDGVAVLRGLPDSVKVVVSEKAPSLVWQSGKAYYALDSDGIPFLRFDALPAVDSKEGTALASVPLVKDTKELPVELGKQPAGGSFVGFVDAVLSNVAKLLPDLKPDHFEVSDTTYDVTLIFKQGMQVQFNSLGDAGVQSRNLARLVQQGKVKTDASAVDLRIDRWAYVK